MPAEDIEWALAETRAKKRRNAYTKARKYYDGQHDMAFASERFETVFGGVFKEIRDNLCPAVVDTVSDRLKITGVNSTKARRGLIRRQVRDPLGARAWEIWKRNRMGQRANEIHRESLLTGDGYAIVWPGADDRAAIWPQLTDEMAIEYSEVIPGELVRAARVWRQRDGHARVNLYYPDKIERYISSRVRTTKSVSTNDLGPLQADGVVENPWGRVPVFHFPNKRLFGYGVSQLHDVIPLQDALNKAVCDMIVAMEFAAFRQRWATGLEVETDEEGKPKAPPFRPGVDRIFTADGEAVRFGEFAETNLEQFLKVQEDLRAEIARVSGTPLHYLFITRGDFPSGEAMKSAESRLTETLEDRHDAHGPTWAQLLSFGLLIEGTRLPRDFDLSPTWSDPAPRSDEERARTGILRRQLGASRRQVLREQGYNDETIDEMLEEEPVQTMPLPEDPPSEQ